MPNKKELTIRMYRQGLGDCFLLSFPGETQPFHLLIDCGALNSKHYDAKVMKDVVSDINVKTKGRLDAVAATHEHWDHISGFSQAKEIFDKIKVDKVWAAWTEEPDNEIAKQFKDQFKKSKKAVEKSLARLPDDKKNRQLGLYKQSITELFGFFGGLGANENGKGRTEEAWENFLNLSRKKVYCDPHKPPLELDGVADVRVFILGPPKDAADIKKKLSKKETYDEGKHGFAAFASFAAACLDGDDPDDREAQARAFPFDRRFRISPQAAEATKFFQEKYGFGDSDAHEWRRIDYDWLGQAGELALHLDSYTNNTCLAIAIEIGGETGKVLLFPGDAQVGNWLSWEKLSWNVRNSDGTMRTVTTDDLLARTVFYKVGHHGSHNATMRAKGLEKMISPELVAMIPVHRQTASDQNWEFPYAPLWKRLRERTCGRVLLADAKDLKEIADEAQQMLTENDWTTFENSTGFEDLCIEYRIAY